MHIKTKTVHHRRGKEYENNIISVSTSTRKCNLQPAHQKQYEAAPNNEGRIFWKDLLVQHHLCCHCYNRRLQNVLGFSFVRTVRMILKCLETKRCMSLHQIIPKSHLRYQHIFHETGNLPQSIQLQTNARLRENLVAEL